MHAAWADQPEPKLVDKREQVIDPMTAYQITSILEGVITRGTGQAVKVPQSPSRRKDRDHQRRQGRVVRGLFVRPDGGALPRI